MDEKGQMFVEFAFCLPIFLLLAFVIISVSFGSRKRICS